VEVKATWYPLPLSTTTLPRLGPMLFVCLLSPHGSSIALVFHLHTPFAQSYILCVAEEPLSPSPDARKPDCFVSFCVFVSLGHFQRSYPLRFRLNQNLCGDFRVRSEMMCAQFSHPAPSVVPCCSFLLRFGPSADVVQTRWSRLVSSLGRHPTTRVYSNRST